MGTLFRNVDHPVDLIYKLCGQNSLHVLGLTNSSPAKLDPYQISATTGNSRYIPHITCAMAATIQVIVFDRPLPHRMQYISLSPISLALEDKDEDLVEHAAGSIEAAIELVEDKKRKATKALVEKLKLHTISRHTPTVKELALPNIVNQINCCWELRSLLLKNVTMIGVRSKRSLSVSERVVESATTMRNLVVTFLLQVFWIWVYPMVRSSFVLGLMCHRVAAEVLLQALEWRAGPDQAAIKDISATAQQVEIRLQQFCYWPMQYVTLRRRKNDWESVTTSHPEYIRFYNSLWLVANDVIIGIALGSYIIENAPWVAYQINTLLQVYTVTALQRTISWLMDWPAGLKLNNELAQFLGDLFLWVIDYWACKSFFHSIYSVARAHHHIQGLQVS